MKDLIIRFLTGRSDPLPVLSLQKKEPFSARPEEFDRHLQALVREGKIVRVKISGSLEEGVILADCIPSPKDQILKVLQLPTSTGRPDSNRTDSIVDSIIGFSKDTARAALQGLVQDGKVFVQRSADGHDIAFLAGQRVPVRLSKEEISERLVKALRRKSNGPDYPVPLADLVQAAGATELDASQVMKVGYRAEPQIFFKTDNRSQTLAAFAEDIEQLVDFSVPLNKLKASGDPKKYPVSLTSLMKVIQAPNQGKGVLRKRLIDAANRPIAGVSVKEIPFGKKTVRKYALRQDEQLLELLSLKKDALQQRVLGLWMELEELRAFRKKADLGSSVDTVQSAMNERGIGISASSMEITEKVWRAIKEESARSKFAWARISDLRNQFDSLSRATMDDALRALSRNRRIVLIPLNDRSILTNGESGQLLNLDGTLYFAVSIREEG